MQLHSEYSIRQQDLPWKPNGKTYILGILINKNWLKKWRARHGHALLLTRRTLLHAMAQRHPSVHVWIWTITPSSFNLRGGYLFDLSPLLFPFFNPRHLSLLLNLRSMFLIITNPSFLISFLSRPTIKMVHLPLRSQMRFGLFP